MVLPVRLPTRRQELGLAVLHVPGLLHTGRTGSVMHVLLNGSLAEEPGAWATVSAADP